LTCDDDSATYGLGALLALPLRSIFTVMSLLLYRFGAVPGWMVWVGLTIDLVFLLTIIVVIIAAEGDESPWNRRGPRR
jgi:hypothetical protein